MSRDRLSEFKLNQQIVVDAINNLMPYLRSYREAKPLLRALREALEVFLGRFDKQFFDQLYHFYDDDRQAFKMIDFLVHDTKDIKIAFLMFFDKHATDHWMQKNPSFPKDFMDFSGRILARIKIEEDYLFPLIKKMTDTSM
jgi:hypothetical protein